MSEKINRISHKEWRKIAKKIRRKNCRQKLAKERDQLLENENSTNINNPSYLTWLAEQEALQLAQEQSEEHLRQETHQKWQNYDKLVQERWKIKQEKLAKIKEAQELEKLRIRDEFDANKELLRKLKEEKVRLAEEKLEQHKRLADAIDRYISESGNLPDELKVNAESNPGKAMCPFFEKTSTCRYGVKCSRNHCRPGISRLLLIPNFFSHIRLDQSKHTEYGSDFSLEIDDSELYRDFVDFFNDVEPELATFGKIINFCVCSNQEPHLRGHTYVEYDDQRNALKACRHLQGRYYAGRRLNVEFSQMITWRSAVCGLSFAKKCPKGRTCNFLHLFKNPRNKYPLFDKHRGNASQHRLSTTRRESQERNRDGVILTNWDEEDATKKRNWRWSESPEMELSTRKSIMPSVSVSQKRTTASKSSGKSPSNSRNSRSSSRSSRNSEKRNERHHNSSCRDKCSETKICDKKRGRTSNKSRTTEERIRSRSSDRSRNRIRKREDLRKETHNCKGN